VAGERGQRRDGGLAQFVAGISEEAHEEHHHVLVDVLGVRDEPEAD
jgi:hypothetical protein